MTATYIGYKISSGILQKDVSPADISYVDASGQLKTLTASEVYLGEANSTTTSITTGNKELRFTTATSGGSLTSFAFTFKLDALSNSIPKPILSKTRTDGGASGYSVFAGVSGTGATATGSLSFGNGNTQLSNTPTLSIATGDVITYIRVAGSESNSFLTYLVNQTQGTAISMAATGTLERYGQIMDE